MPAPTRPYAAIPAEAADGPAARAALAGRRDHRRDRARGAGLRAGDGGRVRPGRRRGDREGARALRRPDRGPGERRPARPRDLRQPRPRRDARRPQPRRPALRLPPRLPARLAALRGGGRGRRPRPRRDLRARRGHLRLHRRALGRVGGGLRRGAVGRGRRAPAPAPPPRAPARAGPARLRGVDPRRGRRRGVAAAADRRRAGHARRGGVRRGPRRTRSRPGSPGASARRRSAPASSGWRSCSCPTPARPRARAA